jgi:hypothetical protein
MLAVVITGLTACGPSGASHAGAEPVTAGDAGPVPIVVEGGEPLDAGAGGEAEAGPSYPAEAPPVPTVVSMGGSVMASPRIVPVFFSNDDAATIAAVTDFVSRVGTTDYWSATTAEYGVGPATSAGAATMGASDDPSGSIDDSAIQTWLVTKLEVADAALPAPDAQTVYVLFYPAGVTVTFQGGQSCTSFEGYHDETALDAAHGATPVAYAVVPRCGDLDGVDGVPAITGVASHELVEVATDPFPLSSPAYLQVDAAHFYWTDVLGGSEVADMCAHVPGALVSLDALPYTVQRTWSNASARAGHDPCVPVPAGEVYFNAAPSLGVVTTSANGQAVQVDGVNAAVDASVTVPLHLFSDAPTSGPWTVTARPAAGWEGELTFSFDRASGADGDVLGMTVHVVGAGKYERELFVVTSTLGATEHTWFGMVTN